MKEEIQIKHVPIGLLEYNTGQIEEFPRTREDARRKDDKSKKMPI